MTQMKLSVFLINNLDQRKKVLERKKIIKKNIFFFSSILKRIARISIREFQLIRNEF